MQVGSTSSAPSSYRQSIQSVLHPSAPSATRKSSVCYDVNPYIREEPTPGTLEIASPMAEFDSNIDKVKPSPAQLSSFVQPTVEAATIVTEAGVEYEEIPPWNTPRSIDDLHFNYSMKCETTGMLT